MIGIIGLLNQLGGCVDLFFDLVRLFSEPMDGGGEGRPGDAEEDVHPPGLAVDRGAVDAEGGLLPQAEADEQHQRQARFRKYRLFL